MAAIVFILTISGTMTDLLDGSIEYISAKNQKYTPIPVNHFRLFARTPYNSSIFIFTDPETDCEYFTYFYGRPDKRVTPTLTPRLNSNGEPICRPHNANLEKH